MYEDRTQDVIVEEMLDGFGKNVRTDENSLAYNACVKTASELEDAYGDISDVYDNMLPDSQDIIHLISYAKERCIEYNYAKAPVVKGVFKQAIEPGEMFTCNDYTYTVESLISGYEYKLICETEGTEANTNFGDLDPVDFIDDYQGGEITEILTLGSDDEDTEAFRKRVLEAYKITSFAGNKKAYREYVNAIGGVGGCKPVRRKKGDTWIYIWIINSDKRAASDSLIKTVQDIIDPELSHGEGDGLAPICHSVQIKSAIEQTVNVTTKIVVDTGYSKETLSEQITDVVENYIYELRKAWESQDSNETIVRLSKIEAAVLGVEGVKDISVKINNEAENLVMSFEYIPVLGGVTVV